MSQILHDLGEISSVSTSEIIMNWSQHTKDRGQVTSGLSGRWEEKGHLSVVAFGGDWDLSQLEVEKGSQELHCKPKSPGSEAEVFTV